MNASLATITSRWPAVFFPLVRRINKVCFIFNRKKFIMRKFAIKQVGKDQIATAKITRGWRFER